MLLKSGTSIDKKKKKTQEQNYLLDYFSNINFFFFCIIQFCNLEDFQVQKSDSCVSNLFYLFIYLFLLFIFFCDT